MLERRPVSGVEQLAIEPHVGVDVAHLLALLDREHLVVRSDERQVPFAGRVRNGRRRREALAHHVGEALDLGLRVGMAAQREEVVVRGGRHDHARPHPRLEHAIDDLLVRTDGAESIGVRERRVTRGKPLGFGGCISFVVGIARELDALRENMRCVLNSDSTNRGNRSTNVVSR